MRFTAPLICANASKQDPTRRATRSKHRNLAHRTTMRAALSHVVRSVRARKLQSWVFDFQPQGDRDSANCLVLLFEFPLVDYERFVGIEFQLCELAFADRKIERGHENRNETRFSSPRQKNFRLDWTRRFATKSKLCKNKVQSFRRYHGFS